jgi:hypothetical protein
MFFGRDRRRRICGVGAPSLRRTARRRGPC